MAYDSSCGIEVAWRVTHSAFTPLYPERPHIPVAFPIAFFDETILWLFNASDNIHDSARVMTEPPTIINKTLLATI
jgi:hypothetical protein